MFVFVDSGLLLSSISSSGEDAKHISTSPRSRARCSITMFTYLPHSAYGVENPHANFWGLENSRSEGWGKGFGCSVPSNTNELVSTALFY